MGPKYYRKQMQCKLLIKMACNNARESHMWSPSTFEKYLLDFFWNYDIKR